MANEEQSTSVEFEILKLVFFVVTYFLITDGLNVQNTATETISSNYSSFYNTLFIFSASTWADYLSSMRSLKYRRYYDGKYEVSSFVPLLGSVIGIFTVSISMYCVCEKGNEFFDLAVVIYYLSLVFIFLKAFVITDMVLNKIKD